MNRAKEEVLTNELHSCYAVIVSLADENSRLKEELSEVYTRLGAIVDEAS